MSGIHAAAATRIIHRVWCCSRVSDTYQRKAPLVSTRFGFVSSYPPTLCGLATFNAALFHELVVAGSDSGRVVRVVDTHQPETEPEVMTQLVNGETGSLHRAVRALNAFDVAIVQHEYGIYGGPDGDEVLQVLEELNIPSIAVLHTVLSAPSPHQKYVLEQVVALADAVVTMTSAARERLATNYTVDMTKVKVIPHGTAAARPRLSPAFRTVQPTILTWGLIGRSKGIEWGVEAMSHLRDMTPMPQYVIAGQTHPKVVAYEGEKYRSELTDQIRSLGLNANVVMDNHYRHTAALAELVSSADVVLLPYDSTEQVTSGVLVEAVAAMKPVVATPFPHAVELLSDGAGILVPYHDSQAIADAVRSIVTDADQAARMAHAAAARTTDVLWPQVAEQYRALASRLIREKAAA